MTVDQANAIDQINVGTKLKLKADKFRNKAGTNAICFGIGKADRVTLFFFLFENGKYMGFFPGEIPYVFDLSSNSFVPEVQNYTLNGTSNIRRDFNRGKFEEWFK